MNLKSWLRRVPQPVKIRAGKAILVVGEGKNKWRDCIEQIEHMQPSRLEALDADGNIIRGVDLESEGEGEPGSRARGKDENTDSELVRLARIISEAHDQGAQRMATAFGNAFQEYGALIGTLSQRLTAVEGSWQALLAQRAQDVENGASGTDPLQGMMAQMIAGKMMSVGTEAPKPNGKGKNGKKRVVDTEGE